jgi:hypothetical protein
VNRDPIDRPPAYNLLHESLSGIGAVLFFLAFIRCFFTFAP